MAAKLQFDKIGYWSVLKLEILKKYAAAYTRIMRASRTVGTGCPELMNFEKLPRLCGFFRSSRC
jgi:hypothetical protein